MAKPVGAPSRSFSGRKACKHSSTAIIYQPRENRVSEETNTHPLSNSYNPNQRCNLPGLSPLCPKTAVPQQEYQLACHVPSDIHVTWIITLREYVPTLVRHPQ